MVNPREWLDGLDLVELDGDMLRALAHPTRSRILSSLRLEGPATSSTLATRLRTNTGQTSYHVRALADVGLVTEDTDRGTGRERWWKAAQRGHSFSDVDHQDDPEGRHAANWYQGHINRLYAQGVAEWLEQRRDWPEDWRRAADSGDGFFLADPARLQEFADELHDLLQRYQDRGDDLDPDDDDVEPVTFIHHAFPSSVLRP